MASPTVEKIAKTNADMLTKSGQAAETMMKGSTEALTESGNAARAAVQELTKAYQELATKNAKNPTAAMQALAAVKSPAEFIELQQKLIKDGVEAAVSVLAGPSERGQGAAAAQYRAPRKSAQGFRRLRPCQMLAQMVTSLVMSEKVGPCLRRGEMQSLWSGPALRLKLGTDTRSRSHLPELFADAVPFSMALARSS